MLSRAKLCSTATVLTICGQFRDFVENNDLSTLLYDGAGKAKHESAAQKLFYGIADSYCAASDLDLTRESNAGRGPVDFKVSRGYRNWVLVEAKLSSNGQLLHGLETQLTEYQKAEKTRTSVFVVIDVDGESKPRVEQLKRRIAAAPKDGLRVPEVVFVNTRRKASASKYRSTAP